MGQLDGLRALAVMGVLAAHWLPANWHAFIPLGVVSGRIFFVLSGFLITGILLRERRRHDEGEVSLNVCLKHFYARRALRIFPLYYSVLIIALLIGEPLISQSFPWHAFHLSNLYFALNHNWFKYIGHLWSLSVEEQFYLVWPWVILLTPRKKLFPLIVLLLACGPIARAITYSLTGDYVATVVSTFSNLDSLGGGAMIALLVSEKRRELQIKICRQGFWWGLCLLLSACLLFTLAGTRPRLSWIILADSGTALFGMWLIAGASTGFGGIVGKTLTLRPLRYIGIVSYGIYLLHPFVGAFVDNHVSLHTLPLRVLFPLKVLVTVGIASASWFCLEKPFNRFKTLFPYHFGVRTKSVTASCSDTAPALVASKTLPVANCLRDYRL